jgi:hypothetical protein
MYRNAIGTDALVESVEPFRRIRIEMALEPTSTANDYFFPALTVR